MMIEYFCKVHVSAYAKILLLLFHWLICILFHVKTKWLPEQHLKPVQIQNDEVMGETNNQGWC